MSSPKRRQRRGKKTFLTEMLQEEVQQRLGSKAKFIATPKGEPKMSEMLRDLIVPYVNDMEDQDEIETLFNFGVVAWNISIHPVEKRPELLTKSISFFPPEEQENVKQLLEALICDKLKFFPEHTLSIVDHKVGFVHGELRISVASSPTRKDALG